MVEHRHITVRPLRPRGVGGESDDDAVAALFRDTMLLGHGHPFDLACAEQYSRVCLGWYLGPGRRDAGLALAADGTICGYALVCTDDAAQARWARSASLRLMVRVVASVVAGRVDRPSRHFYGARLHDATTLWRDRRSPSMPAHAHLNIAAGARSGLVALALRDHIDQRCRLAGVPGWYGEMNARTGTRERALERLGLSVVHHARNHTLSAALGSDVQRLTVVRELGRPIGAGLAAPPLALATLAACSQ